jgi:hypothetical protein
MLKARPVSVAMAAVKRRTLRSRPTASQQVLHQQREHPAGGSAEGGQHQTLDDELASDARSRGAEGEAHGNLAAAGHRSHHQQAGDVDAGEEQEQNERHGSEEEEQQ